MAAPRVTVLAGAAALVIVMGAAGWLATVSLQQDFAAYHTAARARSLGLDPYLNQVATGGPWDGVAIYRHSRFLYPPLIADLFRPLAALPFLGAKLIFTAASVLGLVVALHLLRGEVAIMSGGAMMLLAAAWPPVFVALERGQIDLLLFPLLAGAWRWRNRPLVAGLALGFCALCKPFILGLLPLLVVARQARWAAGVAGALALFTLLSLALGGGALNHQYLTDVLPRAARWGEGGPAQLLLDPSTLDALEERVDADSTLAIEGRRYALQVGDFRRNASLPRALAGDGTPSAALELAVALGGGLLLAWAARRRRTTAGWYWGGLLLGVVAAPVSWAMSLVWALPVVLGWQGAADRQRPRLVALVVAAGAGLLGPWVPGAWVAAGVAGIGAAALWPPPERR